MHAETDHEYVEARRVLLDALWAVPRSKTRPSSPLRVSRLPESSGRTGRRHDSNSGRERHKTLLGRSRCLTRLEAASTSRGTTTDVALPQLVA